MTTGLLITTAGRNAIIADLGGGADLVLTHVAWGDANGVPYNPNQAQVALVNEKYRATIASVAVVGGAIVVDAVIPDDTDDGSGRPSHGFNVAEVGLFSSSGTLIGVARCGNGYKPPPTSGQIHNITYRLKLAVANPSAITVVIDPLSQINVGRHVRPFWLTVDGVLNDPPAVPSAGSTFVIGAAPTGAWTGFAHRLAQWVGVWALSDVPRGHQIVDSSAAIDAGNRWLERTVDGWVPGVTRLVQHQPGNFALASGTANELTVTLDPPLLAYAEGLPLRVKIASDNTGPVTIKSDDLGFVPIVNPDGSALIEGALIAGQIAELVCTGAGFQFMGSKVGAGPLSIGRIVTVTASTTWTRREGCRALLIEGVGGGGAGGGAQTVTSGQLSMGGGGGSGGFFRKLIRDPAPSYEIVIGAGGIGVAGLDGGNGGTTSFGAEASASGGVGGQCVKIGVNSATSATGGPGGSAVGGDVNAAGGIGLRGATSSTGGYGGAGGNSHFGGNGLPSAAATDNGGAASGPGGGGGGAVINNTSVTAKSGGNGAPGLVVITEFY